MVRDGCGNGLTFLFTKTHIHSVTPYAHSVKTSDLSSQMKKKNTKLYKKAIYMVFFLLLPALSVFVLH